jgi:hypothetical protein
MSRKHSKYGIVSILFSVPFYILMRLFYMTDRLDKFYQQNFIYDSTAKTTRPKRSNFTPPQKGDFLI